MFEKYLQEIGLNEKEAAIYLALLEVDNASVIDVSKKTKINRSTVYFTLEGLMKKGLVSETQVGKKVHYQAEAPERLETYVERQKVLLTEKSKRLKDIIPELKGIQRKEGERPIIKFFEGREGVVSAYEEFYSSLDDKEKGGYLIYNMDLLNDTYSEDEQERFYQIRANKKVLPTVVYNKKEGDHTFVSKGVRTRLDADKYPISADISIVGDKIILSTLGDYISSFIIKSRDIATTISSLVAYINDQNKKG